MAKNTETLNGKKITVIYNEKQPKRPFAGKINKLSFRYIIAVMLLIFFIFSVNNFQDYVIRYGAVNERDYVNYTIPDTGVDMTAFRQYRDMNVPVMSLSKQFFTRVDAVATLFSKHQITADFETWLKTNMNFYYELQFGLLIERAAYQVFYKPIKYFYEIFVRFGYIPEWWQLFNIIILGDYE